MPSLYPIPYTLYPKKGFTLIELLIVMAILGLLSTISLANFQTTRIKARDAQRKSDLSTIAKSLEAYANDHQAYPASDTNHQIVCQPPTTTCSWGATFTDGQSTYTATLPADPGGYSYEYVAAGDGSSFSLYAYLENTNDPSIVAITPSVSCGTQNCNYKITSSNIK